MHSALRFTDVARQTICGALLLVLLAVLQPHMIECAAITGSSSTPAPQPVPSVVTVPSAVAAVNHSVIVTPPTPAAPAVAISIEQLQPTNNNSNPIVPSSASSAGPPQTLDKTFLQRTYSESILSPAFLPLDDICAPSAKTQSSLCTIVIESVQQYYTNRKNAKLPTGLLTVLNDTLNENIDAYPLETFCAEFALHAPAAAGPDFCSSNCTHFDQYSGTKVINRICRIIWILHDMSFGSATHAAAASIQPASVAEKSPEHPAVRPKPAAGSPVESVPSKQLKPAVEDVPLGVPPKDVTPDILRSPLANSLPPVADINGSFSDLNRNPSQSDDFRNAEIDGGDDDDDLLDEDDTIMQKGRKDATPYLERKSHPLVTVTGSDPFVAEDESDFFSFFMVALMVLVMLYVAYHNRRLLMALLLEGRRKGNSGSGGANGSRRKHTAAYRKLDSNLEEAMLSTSSSTSTAAKSGGALLLGGASGRSQPIIY